MNAINDITVGTSQLLQLIARGSSLRRPAWSNVNACLPANPQIVLARSACNFGLARNMREIVDTNTSALSVVPSSETSPATVALPTISQCVLSQEFTWRIL